MSSWSRAVRGRAVRLLGKAAGIAIALVLLTAMIGLGGAVVAVMATAGVVVGFTLVRRKLPG